MYVIYIFWWMVICHEMANFGHYSLLLILLLLFMLLRGLVYGSRIILWIYIYNTIYFHYAYPGLLLRTMVVGQWKCLMCELRLLLGRGTTQTVSQSFSWKSQLDCMIWIMSNSVVACNVLFGHLQNISVK